MSHFETAFLDALGVALRPGDAVAPEKLLAATAAEPNPLGGLGDPDRAQYLFFALQDEFGFLPYLRVTGQMPFQKSQQLWAASLRWLIEGLRTWNAASDPKSAVLCALLAFAAFNDNAKFWEALPDDIGDNLELRTVLRSVIASMTVQYSPRGHAAAPLWEVEAVEALQRADADNDWPALAEKWPIFRSAFQANALQSQSVKYLRRFRLRELVEALDGIEQTSLVMLLVRTLTRPEVLRVALESRSPRSVLLRL
jgi:hypothetical protein